MDASKKTQARRRKAPAAAPLPRVVFTQAPVQLGALIARNGDRWRTRVGAGEQSLRVDAAVDPLLLDEAAALGARVLIDAAAEPVIVGVVQTARALRIERDGGVSARVERFALEAANEVLLKTRNAYVQVKDRDIELYGNKVLTRAREIAKILGRMISLN